MPALTELSPYQCDSCQEKREKFRLCSRCRTARYCGEECQKAHWKAHKEVCFDVTGPLSKEVPPLKAPEDPADPTNPLKLRTRPTISPARLNDLAGRTVPPGQNMTGPLIKLTIDRENDQIFLRARHWDLNGRKEQDLYQGSLEDLVDGLREWVYERAKGNEEIKAIRILSQATSVALMSGRLTPHMTMLEQSVMMNEASNYTGMRAGDQSTKGEWLHQSLLQKLPGNHDYSRFKDANASPDKHIVASLLALDVYGIDQGSFWDLEDSIDELKLRANLAAYPAMMEEFERRRQASN